MDVKDRIGWKVEGNLESIKEGLLQYSRWQSISFLMASDSFASLLVVSCWNIIIMK